MDTERLLEEVEKLNNNTPEGRIIDADTILADLMENVDFEFSGFAQDIFNIWKNSTDRESVEKMFYEFTEIEFNDYLRICETRISR